MPKASNLKIKDSNWRFFEMSLKKWFKQRRQSLTMGVFFTPGSFFSLIIFMRYYDIDGMIVPWPMFVWGCVVAIAVFSFWKHIDVSSHIASLRKHLGVDDLHPYMELSPSAMEDLCLRRLKVLGYAWDEAIKNYPMPFAEERVKAESAFRRAYRFFVHTKCIKPTNWDPFFPK